MLPGFLARITTLLQSFIQLSKYQHSGFQPYVYACLPAYGQVQPVPVTVQ